MFELESFMWFETYSSAVLPWLSGEGLVLRIERRALCILGKWSAIGLSPLLCFIE